MTQPTGLNYRFCHYARGDKSERLPLGLQPVLGNETTPAVCLTLTVDDLRRTSFCLPGFLSRERKCA
jgi:hypothetical protein